MYIHMYTHMYTCVCVCKHKLQKWINKPVLGRIRLISCKQLNISGWLKLKRNVFKGYSVVHRLEILTGEAASGQDNQEQYPKLNHWTVQIKTSLLPKYKFLCSVSIADSLTVDKEAVTGTSVCRALSPCHFGFCHRVAPGLASLVPDSVAQVYRDGWQN